MALDESQLEACTALIRAEGAACSLRANEFFVAWNGVLTLVYTGFPPAMARIKARLGAVPWARFRPENSGSMWPKTTLGALREGSPPLKLEELCGLRTLCRELGGALLGRKVSVRQLSCVEYTQRGLEAAGRRRVVDEALPPTRGQKLVELPAAEETFRVQQVLGEWKDAESYLARANAPGSRIDSYRAASPSGTSLVCFLRPPGGAHRPPPATDTEGAEEMEVEADEEDEREHLALRGLLEAVAAFRSAVEELLPGRFAWLADESLHCTVRTLDLA